MSALFFKVSWQHNIDRYRELRKKAKANGLVLIVKNTSRTRGIPIFLFYLTDTVTAKVKPYSDLDEVETAIATKAGG